MSPFLVIMTALPLSPDVQKEVQVGPTLTHSCHSMGLGTNDRDRPEVVIHRGVAEFRLPDQKVDFDALLLDVRF